MKRWILALLLVFSAAQLPAATPFPEAVSTSTTTLTLQPTVGVYTFTGSSPATWTLPAVSGNKDRQIIIKNRGSATITVQRAGSDQLYTTSAVTSTTVAAGSSATLINDSVYWVVLSGGGLASTDIDTSSELAGILTDETGSGAAVFATSPTFTTSTLINRAGTTDYGRTMFQTGGTEMWALGLRGDNGGAGTNNTFTITGNAADSYPNLLNLVPNGSNYAAYWFGSTTSNAAHWENANGACVFNEQGAAENFRVESDTNANMLFVDGTNNRVGIGLNNPSTALEVSGTVKATAFNGTVFVRDGTFLTGTTSPVDNNIYYGGQGDALSTTANARKMYIPSACTLTKFYGWFACTAGTSEQSTISVRVNNTTDYTVTSTLALVASTEYNNTSLSISLNAGDYIEVKWQCPTWVTNPTAVRGGFTMEFQK